MHQAMLDGVCRKAARSLVGGTPDLRTPFCGMLLVLTSLTGLLATKCTC